MLQVSPEGERWLRESIAMIIIIFLFACLRFYARAQSAAPFAADDWWLLFSILIFYAFLAIIIWIATQGRFGYPPPTVPLPLQVRVGKLCYAAELLSVSATATAKISLLCLYRRVFSTPSFRRNSLVVICFVVAYWVTHLITLGLQCIPMEKLWIPTEEGRCINFAAMFLGLELGNCILDIVMLFLPLNVIRGLQMSMRHKLQLAVLFFLGSVVFIVGTARMAVLYKARSDEIDGVRDNICWLIIENGFAVICACLPTYRPLLAKGFSLTTDFRAWYSSLLRNTRSWGGDSRSSKSTPSTNANKAVFESRKRYNQIEDGILDRTHLTSVTGDLEASTDTVAGKDFPLNSI